MNLTDRKENFKISFVACRSDITSTRLSTITTVDMAVKWRLNPTKSFVFSSSIPQSFPPMLHLRLKLEHTLYYITLYWDPE
jgi:regulator of protease activity HflC (stomatin/prohibitin superfamily)